MRRHIKFFLILSILVFFTSCITLKREIDTYTVENPIKLDSSINYKNITSMSKTYSVKYTFFSNKQKPSDEEIVEKIQKQTKKKYGENAIASDIVFTKSVKETVDVAATLLNSTSLVDGTKYKIEAKWNVYIPNN